MKWSKLWEYGHTARKSSKLHWFPASSCFTSSLSTACNHPDVPNMLVSHNTYQMTNEHLEIGLCGKHNLWIMHISVFTLPWQNHISDHEVESAFSSWSGQDIFLFFWNPKIHHFVKGSVQLVLRQFNSVYWLTSSFSETHFRATER